MKLLASLLALFPLWAHADLKSSLGKSPDEQFELILTASSAKDHGRVIVRDLKDGTTTETDSGQGYGYIPTGDVKGVWKKTSSAFAVTMRGTKRTWNTDVYIREGEAWEKLEFPPYVANILGRQGVFKGGRSFHEAFGGFQGDNRFALFSHIEPDWQQQEQIAKTADWKPTTQTEWKIVLEYHHRMRPNCSIVSIEPLTKHKSDEGGADQPAKVSESTPEGNDEVKPESEVRPK